MSTGSTFRRLRGIFAKTAPKSIDVKTTTETILTSSKSKPHQIVDFLIKSSQCPTFRRERVHYEVGIRRLANSKHFSGIEQIINHQKQYPDIRHETFVVPLIVLYGTAKMYDHARNLFDEMPQLNCPRTVLSFNALLTSCVKSEKYDKVGELFRELPPKLSIEPDLFSYNLAIKALCKAGSLDSAVFLLDEIEKHGIKPDIVTCNTLLNAFYQSKRFTEAENLWAVMGKRNIVPDIRTYNARLRGLIKVNEVSKAIQLFEEIVKKGFKPDAFSYNAMIKMYVDEGNLDEAKMWYEKMVQNGGLPDRATFQMLLPLACDKKEFDFSLRLCKKAISSNIIIYKNVMQSVVDGLVENSEIEDAKELVNLAKSSNFRFELSLPLHN